MEKKMIRKNKLTMQDLGNKKVNMHCHTIRCRHASGEDREYVEKAIEAGYDVLGFSDHTPYIFEKDYEPKFRIRMKMDEFEGYVNSVLKLRDEFKNDIDIYLGLETEYFPNYIDKTMEEIYQYPMDYMILGQHFYDDEVGWISPKHPWDDEQHLEFYVERVLEALATERFLYVAHPDIMNFTGSQELYCVHMMRIVKELKKRNMPIEINVNGFREGLHYPNPLFIEMGIENENDFIIGVDAHSPKELLDFETYEKCKHLVTDRGGNVINCL